MGINIPEILVANGTGMVMLVFLMFFRIRKKHQFSQVHEQIFSIILVLALIAITSETLSFLIDGKVFPGCYFLQYVSNTLCVGLMAVMGFLWGLFVDYRIYYNTKRLKRKAIFLSIPLFLIAILLLCDWFGCGFIFKITPENCYIRGKLNIVIYIALFIYFAENIVNALTARKNGVTPFFFPIYCFIVPCMVGSIIQILFYGISLGWLSTAMATVFVYLELQIADYYVDSLSGLFNRRYINYYLSQKNQRDGNLHGILIDINDFKDINDIHGHMAGDSAIRVMGKILLQSLFNNAIAIRVGGDEFVVFLSDSNSEECRRQMEVIQKNIVEYNDRENEDFSLSVSMGSNSFNGKSIERFLSELDSNMYEVKRKYHQNK